MKGQAGTHHTYHSPPPPPTPSTPPTPQGPSAPTSPSPHPQYACCPAGGALGAVDDDGRRAEVRRVDGDLGREATAGDVHLVLDARPHEELGRDESCLAGRRVKVAHVAHADVPVEREAERRRRHGAAEDAVAVDRLAPPRPKVGVHVVILDDELHETLAHSATPLVQQRGAADEPADLQHGSEVTR